MHTNAKKLLDLIESTNHHRIVPIAAAHANSGLDRLHPTAAPGRSSHLHRGHPETTPPLRPKIRLPPPRPHALTRKRAPNPSLTPALGRHRHGQTRIAVEILHTSPAVQLITGLPRSHLLAPSKPCVGCPTSSLHDLITDITDRESALLVPGSWWSPLQAPGVRSSQVHQHGLAVRRANSGCADKAASKRSLPPSCTARDQLPDPAEGVGRASHELWHTHIVAGWCIRLRCLSMALPIVSTPSRPPICGKAPLPESLYPPQRPILLPWTPVPVQKKTPQRMTSKG